MSYAVEWLVENKVIYAEVHGDTTLDILQQASESIKRMIEASDAPLVHVIVNESEMGKFPKQIKGIVGAADFLRHSRLGWFVIYGNDSALMQFLSQMVARVGRLRHRRVTSQAEAYDFLLTVDSTLPPANNIAI